MKETEQIEFKKSTIDSNEKLTAIQKMNKVCTFIQETTAIPKALKEGLYLKNISKDTMAGEVTYTFGYEYENLDVVMEDKVKEQLELNDYVEIVVNNADIIRGKWLMLEPEVIGNEREAFTIQSDVPLNLIHDEKEEESMRLSKLECAYIFHSLEESVLNFEWVHSWVEK